MSVIRKVKNRIKKIVKKDIEFRGSQIPGFHIGEGSYTH